MEVVYGTDVSEILPTMADFRARSALGAFHSRSQALQQLDQTLQTIEQRPNVHRFQQIEQQHAAWVATKGVSNAGGVASKRAGASNTLAAQLRAHRRRLDDLATLMGRVEQLLEQEVSWRTKCLCAELYDPTAPGWGALAPHVEILEQECRMASGWAMHAPDTLAGWSEHGRADLATVTQWPQLATKTRIVLQSHHQLAAWPPWQGMSVRKGLFCHSSAAIAAYLIDANRATLQQGLRCPIRAVDIVHQQPPTQGGMSHWWVAVNRPDEVRMSNTVKRFNRVGDFGLLPLVGGFVVDIWGALWLDQADAAAAQATSTAPCGEAAVREIPFISLGDNLATEQVRVHVRHVYP